MKDITKRSIEADEADARRRRELKRKAGETIPPGRLAALVAALSTKEKGGRRG